MKKVFEFIKENKALVGGIALTIGGLALTGIGIKANIDAKNACSDCECLPTDIEVEDMEPETISE